MRASRRRGGEATLLRPLAPLAGSLALCGVVADELGHLLATGPGVNRGLPFLGPLQLGLLLPLDRAAAESECFRGQGPVAQAIGQERVVWRIVLEALRLIS